MKIREITSKQTHNIRHAILRPNEPIEACDYPIDDDPSTFHLGVFLEDKLIGISSFYEEKLEKLDWPKQFRLRGMATLPEYRCQGVGRMMIEQGFKLLREKKIDVLWCNARVVAFPYYEKLGFKFIGPMFEIKPIGPHKNMYFMLF